MKWGVVVAAGGHETGELASAMGTTRKALAPIGGSSSLARTLIAVAGADLANCVTVSGEDVHPHVSHGQTAHEGNGAIDNIRIGLSALEPCDAILMLPADTPFMTPEMLQQFCDGVASRILSPDWLAVGLARAQEFQNQFPELPSDSIRLKEGRFVSGALYAATPTAFGQALDLVTRLRDSRKSQFSLVQKLGLLNLIRYFLGQADLTMAERVLTQTLGADAIIVTDCHPATCLDFDSASEYLAIRNHPLGL